MNPFSSLLNRLFTGCLLSVCVLKPAQSFQTVKAANDYQISVDAYSGQPFGVCVVTLVPRNSPPGIVFREPHAAALEMLGANAFYPVVETVGGISM